MDNESTLANHFLIAMPAMGDPNFAQTVSYVCEHNENGAVGIIINRPMPNILLGDLFNQLNIPVDNSAIAGMPVFYGGPVQPDRGFVLHRPSGQWRSSLALADDIHITTSQDILEAIAQGDGPASPIIALGYAGWGTDQLEEEMARNAWLTCPANSQLLFDTPYHEQWEAAAQILGVDIRTISSDSGHA